MTALTLVTWLALAADLTPAKYAEVLLEQREALKAVDLKHGNKPSTALDPAERAQIAAEHAAAQQAVLDKHQLDRKAFARYGASLSRQEQAQAKAREAELEAQPKAPASKEGIPIQRGFSDQHPVELEPREGEAPLVEEGAPGSSSKSRSTSGGGKHKRKRSR